VFEDEELVHKQAAMTEKVLHEDMPMAGHEKDGSVTVERTV